MVGMTSASSGESETPLPKPISIAFASSSPSRVSRIMSLLRSRRLLLWVVALTIVGFVLFTNKHAAAKPLAYLKDQTIIKSNSSPPRPKYIPQPSWTAPPVRDPFPALATSTTPPPIPAWNVPKPNLHKDYGLAYAPPLFIGFTRSWPLILQAVVSYITAGWPAEQIYVVENTGVQWANARGKLTLQNPFYLNHTQLKTLGVNVVQTPVLMSFAQLQNFYTHLAHEHEWPYYYWSHMDIVAMSLETGEAGVTPKASEPGYKPMYQLCLEALKDAIQNDKRWAMRFFAYDHLSLVNREAYDEVGGWDTFIPYHITDCDMYQRLRMHNWTLLDRRAGFVTDVSTALTDLLALYRDPSVTPDFIDPNPPPPPPNKSDRRRRAILETPQKKDIETQEVSHAGAAAVEKRSLKQPRSAKPTPDDLEYWQKIWDKTDAMLHYKHQDRERNVWQLGQRGGKGEPFYYSTEGTSKAIEILTEAGKEVYRNKWGHKSCDLINEVGLKLEDQWMVQKDWW